MRCECPSSRKISILLVEAAADSCRRGSKFGKSEILAHDPDLRSKTFNIETRDVKAIETHINRASNI